MQDIFISLTIWFVSIVFIFLATLLFQRSCQSVKSISPVHRITIISACSALAAILMFLEIPLFFAPSFYKIDLSEIPALICSFYLGPVAGLTAEALKILLKLLLKGTTTAFVGDYANFIIGASFILPASILYHRSKSKKTALFGMAVGGVAMTVIGSLVNAYYLIPTFSSLFGLPMETIISMGTAVNRNIHDLSSLVLWAVVPFNILKAFIDSLLTFLLYKRIEKIFFRS